MNINDYKRIQNFQESDIEKIWDELKTRFGFNVQAWKKSFKEFLGAQPRNTSIEDAFLLYGNKRINPVLNDILCRNHLFPTFNNFVEYILKTNK